MSEIGGKRRRDSHMVSTETARRWEELRDSFPESSSPLTSGRSENSGSQSRNEFSVHAQRSRFLVLTKRNAAWGDENVLGTDHYFFRGGGRR